MREQDLRELLEAIRTRTGPGGRPLTSTERETRLEERLGALLQARYGGDDLLLSGASRAAVAARLLAAARVSRPATAARACEADSRANGRVPPGLRRDGTADRHASRLRGNRGRRWSDLRPAGAIAGVAVAFALLWVGSFYHPWRAPSGRDHRPRAGAATAVRLVRAPSGAEVPEGVLDPAGILHLTYGRDHDAYYVRASAAGSPSWGPTRLNRRLGTVTLGGERGPKLALGRDGVVHVVWLGLDPGHPGVWYTRSTDGGRMFEPERNVLDTKTGCESATVVADQQGNVWIFWLDGRVPSDPTSVMAAPIFMARSTDNGRTFARNERVRHDYPGQACACCRLEARVSADSYLYLSFRSASRNIRDAYLLRGHKRENMFPTVRISDDEWVFAGCPGSGIPFSLEENGRVLASWMSRGRVYWAMSRDGGRAFGPRIAAPEDGGHEDHPVVLANRRGEVLLVWKEGPRVRWASYDLMGRFTGQRGVAGATPGRDKPLAFVGRDGEFRIVLCGIMAALA